mmetsp:Transcript_9013/g.25123  ORF Transcript_9013/g.25123 Transcript_9013/m.25123 type:complete len:217 (+) Transcript_9013:565-1215(+)
MRSCNALRYTKPSARVLTWCLCAKARLLHHFSETFASVMWLRQSCRSSSSTSSVPRTGLLLASARERSRVSWASVRSSPTPFLPAAHSAAASSRALTTIKRQRCASTARSRSPRFSEDRFKTNSCCCSRALPSKTSMYCTMHCNAGHLEDGLANSGNVRLNRTSFPAPAARSRIRSCVASPSFSTVKSACTLRSCAPLMGRRVSVTSCATRENKPP